MYALYFISSIHSINIFYIYILYIYIIHLYKFVFIELINKIENFLLVYIKVNY